MDKQTAFFLISFQLWRCGQATSKFKSLERGLFYFLSFSRESQVLKECCVIYSNAQARKMQGKRYIIRVTEECMRKEVPL